MVQRCFSSETMVRGILLLGLFLNVSSATFILLPSLLMGGMVAGGGLLLTTMTGGLLMMMMAANQQQRQSSSHSNQGASSFLRNLGLIPSASTQSSSNADLVQDLIVRRRRRKRDASQDTLDEVIQYRIMRQIASADPFNCLSKTLCGMATAPPSSQSGLLNDYAYLLKNVFTRDEDEDLDKEFDDLKSSDEKKKKIKKDKKKKKKKKPNESSEEEDDEPSADEEELDAMRYNDKLALEHAANEHMLEGSPGAVPFAMYDSMKQRPANPKKRPVPMDYLPPMDDLSRMSESDLDDLMSRLEGNGPLPPPPGGIPPETKTGGAAGLLSKLFLPKISVGFTRTKDFSEDPFFNGFRRKRTLTRTPTQEENELLEEVKFLRAKRNELAGVKDPVEKFRIAAEVGETLKSPRQCRFMFNQCPWNYTQMLGMIADFRKAIMGQPLTPAATQQQDTVVQLKPIQGISSPPRTTNVISLGGRDSEGGDDGLTSIMHELPSGEKVEIRLRLGSNGKKQLINKNDDLDTSPKNKEKSQLESLKATMIAIQTINNLKGKTNATNPDVKTNSELKGILELLKSTSSAENENKSTSRRRSRSILRREEHLRRLSLGPGARKPRKLYIGDNRKMRPL